MLEIRQQIYCMLYSNTTTISVQFSTIVHKYVLTCGCVCARLATWRDLPSCSTSWRRSRSSWGTPRGRCCCSPWRRLRCLPDTAVSVGSWSCCSQTPTRESRSTAAARVRPWYVVVCESCWGQQGPRLYILNPLFGLLEFIYALPIIKFPFVIKYKRSVDIQPFYIKLQFH